MRTKSRMQNQPPHTASLLQRLQDVIRHPLAILLIAQFSRERRRRGVKDSFAPREIDPSAGGNIAFDGLEARVVGILRGSLCRVAVDASDGWAGGVGEEGGDCGFAGLG